jgi:hypothetical protein
MEKTQIQWGISPAPVQTPAQTVVVGHFDVHGISAAYLAARAFNAVDAFANYPATSPETLVQTLQNLFAAAPSRLRIIVVDIPVNLKDPTSFIQGLENLALRHEVLFFDHHESSVPYLPMFQRVRTFYVGPSALQMNMLLYNMIPEKTDIDRLVALVGAIGDRDVEVVKQGLFSQDLQTVSDGFDVMVRERDGALNTLKALLANPMEVINSARARAAQIPSAQLETRIGPVAVASGQLPPQWGPKALEKLAFSVNAYYAVGYGYDERNKTWNVRAIIRWDEEARKPYLPKPGAVARSLWPTRSIIGHPSAPSVAAATETEAREMALAWARAIADAVTKSTAPTVASLISESRVGEMLAEILYNIERILEEQKKMYSEYLELKKQQVELLKQTRESRARAD